MARKTLGIRLNDEEIARLERIRSRSKLRTWTITQVAREALLAGLDVLDPPDDKKSKK